jgi:predicted PurR-regulated permease PerM
LATLLLTLAFGLDLWMLWGLLAFLLEFVPTIGSVLAVIPPALYAAVQFDGLARPLGLTLALTVMQLFLGNYVDPKIEGRMLSLSPFVVLASIVLWAWVWGAAGALLGVPLTIAVTTIARHFDGTRWLWALLTTPQHEPDEEAGDARPGVAGRGPG